MIIRDLLAGLDETQPETPAASVTRAATIGSPILPIDRLRPLLRGFIDDGHGRYKACCPVHNGGNEQHPSLGITEKQDGTLLMHCFVCGPSVKAPTFLMQVGLTQSELYPQTRTKVAARKGEPVETYDYIDRDGALRYQACRLEPKDFRQRRPNGQGGWVWNLRGVERILYRLPQLIAADPAQLVFIVEGERKADRLNALGFVATCNVGGAGKWRQPYNDYFAGRNVVILPDNDQPGADHAAKVTLALSDVANSVRTVNLPGLKPKGDIVDWLAAGGTAAQLREMVAASAAMPPASSASDVATPIAESTQLVVVNSTGEDDSREPLPMPEIIARMKAVCGDWPRRVGISLFVHERAGEIDWINNPAALLGYIGSRSAIPPKFTNGPGYHTKPELYEETRRTAQAYDAVAMFPHEPPMAGHYYTCAMVEPGDGAALRGLTDRFNPETEIDGILISAFYATMAWGGPGGSRPAFGITSDDGRGVGKTKLVQVGASLFGGVMEFSAGDDPEQIKQRLLSPEGLTKRVALLDNIKRSRFSSAEIESLITAPTISGKRMYVGEGSRPNTLVWAVTMNGGSYSTDLAQRTVFIKLKRPTHTGSWSEQTHAYIDANRDRIIADLVGLLRNNRHELRQYSRWGAWERDVLCRLPNPAEVQRVIIERQGVADVEVEECDLIEDFFRQQLRDATYNTERDIVFIPSAILCNWLSKALNEHHTTTAATRTINQRIGEGKLPRLKHNKCRTYGRGFLWWGEDAVDDCILTDIEIRIDEIKKQRDIDQFREKREAGRGF